LITYSEQYKPAEEAIQADQQDQRAFWAVIFKDSLRIGDYRIENLTASNVVGGASIWAILKDGDDYPATETFPTLQAAVNRCVIGER
jgi:hypothetical protein